MLKSVYNTDDLYIVSLDLDYSNAIVSEIIETIREWTFDKSNICIIKIICFEHMMSEFKFLCNWVGVKEEKGLAFSNVVNIIGNICLDNKMRCNIDTSPVQEYCNKYNIKYRENGYEKLIKSIVADICQGKNYFNLNKGNDTIGPCWFNSCCIYNKDDLKYKHSKCGLKEDMPCRLYKIMCYILGIEKIAKVLDKAGVDFRIPYNEIEAYILREELEENL